MTKLAILTLGALLAASGSAMAADLSIPAVAPIVAAAPAFDWSGAYIGVNGGYAWGTVDYSSPALSPTAPTSGTATGWLGGLTAGYNADFGQFVLGVEGDIDAAHISGSTGDLDTSGSPAVGTSTINWLGTVRGRIGFAADNFLVYATGGVAAGGVDNSVTNLLHSGDDRAASGTQVGWAIGAGVEAGLTENVTVKAEYLYTDLGSSSYTFSNPTYPGEDVTANVHPTANIVRIGLNYKF